MYRARDFQFVTISMDSPDLKDEVAEFLEEQQASNRNYHFSEDDSYALIEAVDPEWAGADDPPGSFCCANFLNL